MPDVVSIDGLQVRTVIGVYAWERNVLQDLRIDLAVEADTRPAADSDNLDLAVDYAEIAAQVTELAAQSRFQLIESLAESVSQLVLERFRVSRLSVRISKPGAVTNARAVGVTITRPDGPVLL